MSFIKNRAVFPPKDQETSHLLQNIPVILMSRLVQFQHEGHERVVSLL